jgi:hypothetical protein
MAGSKPLEGPPAPTLPAGAPRTACHACFATDWIERPDGTAVCMHCIRHASVSQPTTNGDFTWCPTCVADHWRALDAKRTARA